MKFKKNLHIAKPCRLEKINKMIEHYPKPYAPAKYLIFIKAMLEAGWKVKIYVANKVSKYVFIIKGDTIYKIRFSNHKPLYGKELENDCDFYVGISHKQVTTTEELLKKLNALPQSIDDEVNRKAVGKAGHDCPSPMARLSMLYDSVFKK